MEGTGYWWPLVLCERDELCEWIFMDSGRVSMTVVGLTMFLLENGPMTRGERLWNVVRRGMFLTKQTDLCVIWGLESGELSAMC